MAQGSGSVFGRSGATPGRRSRRRCWCPGPRDGAPGEPRGEGPTRCPTPAELGRAQGGSQSSPGGAPPRRTLCGRVGPARSSPVRDQLPGLLKTPSKKSTHYSPEYCMATKQFFFPQVTLDRTSKKQRGAKYSQKEKSGENK